MKTRNWIHSLHWIDYLILLVCLFLAMLLVWKHQESESALSKRTQLEITIAVPNLDPEVASQIQLQDVIVDQAGVEQFEIIEKEEKASEHPVITQNGELLIAKHPKLTSLFLKIRSVRPMIFQNGIQYNWQVIKVGGNLIWETKLTRFVGLVRKIE